jgi:hypothetical protein
MDYNLRLNLRLRFLEQCKLISNRDSVSCHRVDTCNIGWIAKSSVNDRKINDGMD